MMVVVSEEVKPGALLAVGYGELFEQVKAEVRAARLQTARAVNIEVIDLYWRK